MNTSDTIVDFDAVHHRFGDNVAVERLNLKI